MALRSRECLQYAGALLGFALACALDGHYSQSLWWSVTALQLLWEA